MDIFVARQPIFDADERVVGYELLHGTGIGSGAPADAVSATTQLLSEHLLADAWDQLTGGRMAWVRFPARLLLDDTVLLAPPDRTIVEVGRADATDEVLAVCAELAGRGYVLAADDVRDPGDDSPLLDLANIVKVDFAVCGADVRRAMADRFGGSARLVAAQVERREDQAEAIELGYGLLQGRFLSEPALVSRHSTCATESARSATRWSPWASARCGGGSPSTRWRRSTPAPRANCWYRRCSGHGCVRDWPRCSAPMSNRSTCS